jgi:hypothetical protein
MHASNKTSRVVLCLSLLILAVTWAGPVQSQQSSKSPDAMRTPATMDETLAQAMENNPNIVAARAKVKLAEAELNATKLEVARTVIALWTDRQTRGSALNQALEQSRRAPTEAEREAANRAIVDSKALTERLDAELRYQAGKAAPVAPAARQIDGGEKAFQMPSVLAREKVRQALAQPIVLNFRDARLHQVIAYISDHASVQFQLDQRGLAEDGVEPSTPMTVNYEGLTLGGALQALEDQSGFLKFVVRDYGVLVTTPGQAKNQGYYPAIEQPTMPLDVPRGAMVERCQSALGNATEMSFTDTPISDVAMYLQDVHKIEIELDKKHSGLDPNTAITMNVCGIPLASALQAIEDEYPPIRFVIRDYGLLLTTRETARREGYLSAVDFARLSGGAATTPSKPAASQTSKSGRDGGKGAKR